MPGESDKVAAATKPPPSPFVTACSIQLDGGGVVQGVKVKLATPIKGHQGMIAEIVLREPAFAELMKFGEPFARGITSDRSVIYTAENTDTIRQYIEALVQAPADGLLIEQCTLRDTLRIKDALLGFFSDARSE